MSEKKTHEQYVQELAIKNPNLEVLDLYVDTKTKIKHRCLKHNYVWDISPDSAKHKEVGCKMCRSEKISAKIRKSNKHYIDELKSRNLNFEVLEEYINAYTNILHKCKICNYEWKVRPANILSGKGCPMCAGHVMNQKIYIEKLSKINPNIIPLTPYKTAKTKLKFKCLICDFEWSTTPDVTLRGCGCPECGKSKQVAQITKTHKQYVDELSKYNPNIEPVENYINALVPIKHRCKIDGCEWIATPAHLLNDTGCPVCANSKGETKVREWLITHNISYETQKKFEDCKDKKLLPFDFYLPEYNTCIEYDGEQHYRPVTFGCKDINKVNDNFVSVQKHDQIKNEYCKGKGIRLIRIPYFNDVNKELDLLFT